MRKLFSYEQGFYSKHIYTSKHISFPKCNGIYGFPCRNGNWCNSRLKVGVLDSVARGSFDLREVLLSETDKIKGDRKEWSDLRFSDSERELVYKQFENQRIFLKCPKAQGASKNIVQYLGIAADEPERIARHEKKKGIVLPLVLAEWDEAYCRKWCEENDLLSPIYTTSARGGCWFCHNQDIDSLRRLRRDYPDLWALLLKWDNDSPVSFHADGHTVHDFDKRFQLEDEMLLDPNGTFRWNMLDGDLQMRLL